MALVFPEKQILTQRSKRKQAERDESTTTAIFRYHGKSL
jgi:hypothetical protein